MTSTVQLTYLEQDKPTSLTEVQHSLDYFEQDEKYVLFLLFQYIFSGV